MVKTIKTFHIWFRGRWISFIKPKDISEEEFDLSVYAQYFKEDLINN